MAAESSASPHRYASLDDVPIDDLMPLGRALARLLYDVWMARSDHLTTDAAADDVTLQPRASA